MPAPSTLQEVADDPSRHYCEASGYACWETEDGRFRYWMSEYDVPVNYCPLCGEQAPEPDDML